MSHQRFRLCLLLEMRDCTSGSQRSHRINGDWRGESHTQSRVSTADRSAVPEISPDQPKPRAPTTCIMRGLEIRKVACKPCQADSLTPVTVPVFSRPKHQECTLHNTGTFPKIQACATCGDRLEKSYQLDTRPLPAAVLAAIPRNSSLLIQVETLAQFNMHMVQEFATKRSNFCLATKCAGKRSVPAITPASLLFAVLYECGSFPADRQFGRNADRRDTSPRHANTIVCARFEIAKRCRSGNGSSAMRLIERLGLTGRITYA